MEGVHFVISCLFIFLTHLSTATPTIEYPYSFMTTDAKKAAERTYDYIIVGGGTAGCPLAATLSQNYSVLVLERGGSPYGNPDIENSTAFIKLLGAANNYVVQKFVTEDGVQLARARVLGGGTAINAGFYSRASLEYIRRMGLDEKVVNQSYQWLEKQNAFKPDKLFLWNSAVKDSLLEAGVLPYNGYTVDHVEGTKISASTYDNNGKRHTAADLLKYANPNNIVVLLNATVSRILVDSSSDKLKAIGVEFTSVIEAGAEAYQVFMARSSRWSEIILSAGSIGSTQLLLLSGIGPSQHLKEFNIPVLLDSPSIGQGVQDHTRATITIESPKPLEFGSIQVVAITDNSILYIESSSFVLQNNDTNSQYFGSIFSKVAFPLSRGELRLTSRDPADSPSVRYNYFSHPFDLQECMLSVKIMADLSKTASIQEFAFTSSGNSTSSLRYLGPALPQNMSDNEAIAKFCRDTLNTMWQIHGGCHADSVIDGRYRVKGVDSLRIVDGSTFKDSPGTNPQATTMMLGRYMGLRILREHMHT